jgi:hypothetical protein
MNLADELSFEVLKNSAQNSRAWDRIRLGRFTGSGLGKLFTEPRSKADKEAGILSQTAMTYIEEKATEIITGEAQGEFSSKATDWGNEWEEHAILELAKHLQCDPDNVQLKPNFVLYGDHSGASPDAYVTINGQKYGGEVKCPYNSTVHLRRLRTIHTAQDLKDNESDYYWQIQANIFFNKIPMWYFASYDPRFPADKRLKVIEVEANPQDIELMLVKLEQALKLRDEIVQYILNK